jgi:hypothetical protein
VAEILKTVADFRERLFESVPDDEVPEWILDVPDLDLVSLL